MLQQWKLYTWMEQYGEECHKMLCHTMWKKNSSTQGQLTPASVSSNEYKQILTPLQKELHNSSLLHIP